MFRRLLWPDDWSTIRGTYDLSLLKIILVFTLTMILTTVISIPIVLNVEKEAAQNLSATIFMNLFLALSIFIVYGFRHTIRNLLPRPREIVSDVKTGALWGVVIFGLTFTLGALMSWIYGLLELEMVPQQFLQELLALDAATLWLAVGVAVIAAPIGEEFFFRGVIHRTFVGKMSTLWSIVISGLLFALFHRDWMQMPQLWVGGMALAVAYHKSRSILGPIVAHAVMNAIPLSILLIMGYLGVNI